MSNYLHPALPCILIDGPSKVKGPGGVQQAIESMFVEARSACCTLYVVVVGDARDIAEDLTLQGHISARLREVGYVGPDLRCAEPGLQGDGLLCLKATPQFERFAMGRGWEYVDGNDELLVYRLLQTLPYNAVVSFKASNGGVYGVPVEIIARHHAEAHQGDCADLPTTLERLTLPLFLSSHSAIVEWVSQRMTWDDFGTALRLLQKPPALDMRAEFESARKSVRGLSTFNALQHST